MVLLLGMVLAQTRQVALLSGPETIIIFALESWFLPTFPLYFRQRAGIPTT